MKDWIGNPGEDGTLRRVYRLMAVLAALGLAACFLWRGFPGAVGFLTGAVISILSFWSLHHLGGLVAGQTTSARIVFLSFRLLLLFGLVYGILKLCDVSLPAMVCGLLLSVAAITLEAIHQMIYARA